jgi:N-dimethylarginine dimethylaminohydrolase
MTILMTPPTYFDVTYQINPWMQMQSTVQKSNALQEWQTLFDSINAHATVITTPPNKAPDAVFTANAGLVRGKEVILSSFRHAERKCEEAFWKEIFETQGFTTYALHDVAFEGAGDALFAGDVLIGGYGFRTDATAYAQIARIWNIEIVPVELIDNRFYHLDTCLCVLDECTILYYKPAFSETSQQILTKRFTCIEVPETEAIQFACNAVVLGKHVILPNGSIQTQTKLESHGFTTETVPMHEFLKSGGAAKCLTLAL